MIKFFFFPNTIAVIGATSNPKKFGNAVTSNILKNKSLKSELFLVSKRSQEIFGLKCYNSILDIPKDVDLAIILIPAIHVENVINQCIKKKVKAIIIVTAGFGEINEEGKRLEKKIAKKCKNAGIRMMGPNCVGIQNEEIGLNASFIQTAPSGNNSMISQSGSFGCACFYEMEKYNIGCSKFANIGNNVDISFDEILDFYKEDLNTEIISIYMETISKGKKFFKSLKEIIPKKPIVILKGGKTKSGMIVAGSHTGAIATDYKILKSSIIQAGATLCENVTDFITALRTFSYLPIPHGENIGILTNSGGSAVILCDEIDEFGLKLTNFNESLKKRLSPHLIPLVKLMNPLDMISVARKKQYYEVTKAMLEDPNIDIVVPSTVIPPFLEMDSDEHLQGIIRAWNETGRKKPIVPLFLFCEEFDELKILSKREKLPLYYTPHDAAYAIKIIIERMKIEKKCIKNEINIKNINLKKNTLKPLEIK